MADAGQGGRRFTIGDGMILIAATGAGLAWAGRAWKAFRENPPGSRDAWMWATVALSLSLPTLLAWTVAVAALRLRKPRPRWRKVAVQPGLTALLAACLGMVLFAPVVAAFFGSQLRSAGAMSDFWKILPAALLEVLAMLSPGVGFAILIAWSLLALQRRWRCERSWVDRAGRVVGVLWIVEAGFFGVVWYRELGW